MIIEVSVLDTPLYTVEHICDSLENAELIKSFSVGKEAFGLESY